MRLKDDDATIPLPKHPNALLLGLSCAGLAANYFRFEIFFSIEFIFGSVFSLVALQFLGLRRGLIASLIISNMTWVIWNHPYAIIIMTCEVAAVGVLEQRTKWGLVASDALYWLFGGIPLVFLFYFGVMHLALDTATVTAFKQALNGIGNALIARLIFTAVAGSRGTISFPLREVLLNLLVLAVLAPSLMLVGMQSRRDVAETDHSVRRNLVLAADRIETNMENWLASNHGQIIHLAEMASTHSTRHMQERIEDHRRMARDLLRIGLLDRDATIVAYSPVVDELGQKNIGKNFADRPFIPTLKSTLRPMLSEVVMGRIGTPKPMVALLAPVISGGGYAGYVTGILDFSPIEKTLRQNAQNETLPDLGYSLLDRNRKIIATNQPGLKVMDTFSRGKGEVTRLDGRISRWIPETRRNISISEQWKRSSYIGETTIGALSEWTLVLEQPIAPFQKAIYERYSKELSRIFFLLLLVLGGGGMLSRKMSAPLASLGALSTRLPEKLSVSEIRDWPRSHIKETQQLIDNVKEMAETLSRQFRVIRTMNTELEERIDRRTRELQESEERFRSLFEKVYVSALIIDPGTGSIIDANEAAASYYGWPRERLRAMNIADINTLDRDEIVREMNLARSEARNQFLFRHRRADGSVRDVEVYSGPLQSAGKTILYSIILDVTDRKGAEESLRESEASLTIAQSISHVGSWRVVFGDGEPQWAGSDELYAIYGYPRGMQMTMATGLERMHPDDRERTLKAWSAALTGDGPAEWEHRIIVDGAVKWLLVRIQVARDREGRPLQASGTVQDITEQRLAEQAVRQSEEKYRTLVETANSVILTWDTSGRVTFINVFGERFFGYSVGELVGRPVIGTIVPRRESTGRDLDALLQGISADPDAFGDNENENITKDGRLVWVRWANHSVRDERGELTGILSVGYDITRRKMAETELSRIAAERKVILDTINMGIWFIRHRTVQWANIAHARMFGYAIEEARGMSTEAFYEGDWHRRIGAEAYPLLAQGETYSTELPMRRKDGSVFWCHLSGRAIDAGHADEGSIWILQDITERRSSEENMKLLTQAVEEALDGVQIIDLEGSIIYANEAAARITGYDVGELIGRPVRELNADGEFDRVVIMPAVQESGHWQGEITGLSKTGDRIPIWLSTSIVTSGDGKPFAMLGVLRDMTERKKTEAALREKTRLLEQLTVGLEKRIEEEVALRLKNEQMMIQQAKLAAMGEMLGAIAHQWRQPLNALGLIVQNLRDAHAHGEMDGPYLDRSVERSMSQIRHMSKTIDDFRTFFLPDKEATEFNVMEAVWDVLTLFSAQLTSHNILFFLTCREEGRSFSTPEEIRECPDRRVTGYRNEFEHVMLNLVNNSRDAILERRQRSGTLQGVISFDFSRREDNVLVRVEDNGGGIPAELSDRIFEPYFTTRDPAKGTGLGLYMSKIIIDQHMHGRLTVSRGAEGAVFTIELPAAERQTS